MRPAHGSEMLAGQMRNRLPGLQFDLAIRRRIDVRGGPGRSQRRAVVPIETRIAFSIVPTVETSITTFSGARAPLQRVLTPATSTGSGTVTARGEPFPTEQATDTPRPCPARADRSSRSDHHARGLQRRTQRAMITAELEHERAIARHDPVRAARRRCERDHEARHERRPRRSPPATTSCRPDPIEYRPHGAAVSQIPSPFSPRCQKGHDGTTACTAPATAGQLRQCPPFGPPC